jgi:hypothetical protein
MIVPLEARMFDQEESLTHEEILIRFKKVLGREMTPEEKHHFFVPSDFPPPSPTESSD